MNADRRRSTRLQVRSSMASAMTLERGQVCVRPEPSRSSQESASCHAAQASAQPSRWQSAETVHHVGATRAMHVHIKKTRGTACSQAGAACSRRRRSSQACVVRRTQHAQPSSRSQRLLHEAVRCNQGLCRDGSRSLRHTALFPPKFLGPLVFGGAWLKPCSSEHELSSSCHCVSAPPRRHRRNPHLRSARQRLRTVPLPLRRPYLINAAEP